MSSSTHGTGRLSLIGTVSIEIAAEGNHWITHFFQADRLIAEDKSEKAPWIDKRAPKRLTDTLRRGAPELDKQAVKEAIEVLLSEIQNSPDSGGIVSAVVSRAVDETISVTIEMTDPPTYTVTLDGDRSMTFSAREIAAHRAITLNEKWLSIHPRSPLNASGSDFEALIDYWLGVAEEIEPLGNVSPWECLAQKLQSKLATLAVHQTKEGLIRSGLYQEENGPLWVNNEYINPILKEAGISENTPLFSRYLKKAGILVAHSKPDTVHGHQCRCWGLNPAFRPDDDTTAKFAPLNSEEEEARP